jgi:cyanophycin synthetase
MESGSEGGIEVCGTRRVWARNAWCPMEVIDADLRVAGSPAAAAGAVPAAGAIDAVLPRRRDLFGPFAAAAGGSNGAADWVRLVADVALVLQSHARGPDVRFRHVEPAADPATFRLVIEARDHQLAEECLAHAVRLVNAARAGDTVDVGELVPDLVDVADEVCLGPSTLLMVRAAEDRDIPWLRISDEWSLVQLGQGVRQRRIWTAETDRTSAIAETISRNKELTKRMLDAAGVPVPRGRLARSPAEAWEAAQAVGLPVVLKPLDANHGRGVFLNLSTRAEVEAAFPLAREEARRARAIVVEQFIAGVEHRLLVVGSKMVACAQGEYIYVSGDGRHTVAELIDLQINSDARRGDTEAMPNKTVLLDSTVLAQLTQEGVTPDTVPAEGRRVLVKRIGTHGADVTDRVHPEIAAAAVRAARAVGLDVAGIDLVAQDITRPLSEQGAMVCEVNAGPQLLVHTMPSSGPGQPVGDLIVAELFPPGDTGRIPLAAIVGRPGGADGDGPAAGGHDATATARLLEGMLRTAGHVAGLTCGAGKWADGWQCAAGSHTGVAAARDLLMSPEIDAAVFELDPHDVIRAGLPFDRVDALVFLPGTADGDDPRAAAVLAALVGPAGGIVVPDDRPALFDLAARGGHAVVLLSAAEAMPPAGAARAVGVRGGEIVHLRGNAAESIVGAAEAARAARSLGGGPAAGTAAVAAALCLGLSRDSIRAGLAAAR